MLNRVNCLKQDGQDFKDLQDYVVMGYRKVSLGPLGL